VALARDLELASETVHELAHAAFRELLAGALGNPALRVAGLAKGSCFELGRDLFSYGTIDRRLPGSCPFALEQSLDTFRHDLVAIGEDRLPAYPGDRHDLGDGGLVKCDETQHQQPLARPVGPGLLPSFFDLIDDFLSEGRYLPRHL
jgi:hypothetical protein